MFCTKCGLELQDQVKFCSECGTATRAGVQAVPRPDRLTRTNDGKIAGVCAGFARYFGVDVTVVRIIWLVITIWPLPLFGVVAYIIAWIVMPKDPLPLQTQVIHPANS